MCRAGAGSVQELLQAHPEADVRVYAVWLPMLAPDARSAWDPGLLSDDRVRHFWDGERVAGTWFADVDLGGLGGSGVVWDAYYLFGADAVWNDRPGPVVGSGSTVIGHAGELRDELTALF